jgi:hypothetical protein
MRSIRVFVLALVTAQLGMGGPVSAQDAGREQEAPLIHVREFENQPIEVTFSVPDRASEYLMFPDSIAVRNTSIYGISFGAIDIAFRDVPHDDERFHMQVGWGKNTVASNYVTRGPLEPGETVVLPIPADYYAELAALLRTQHRHVSDIHEVVISLDCLALDNGYNFVPSGYVRVLYPLEARRTSGCSGARAAGALASSSTSARAR